MINDALQCGDNGQIYASVHLYRMRNQLNIYERAECDFIYG